MVRTRAMFAVALGMGVTGSSFAQCDPQLVSMYCGSARDVAIVGDMAFIAASEGGLHVVNVSVPRLPRLRAIFNEIDFAAGIEVVGDVLYIAAESEGLVTVDITEPASPRVIGSLELDGAAHALALDSGYAFVGTSAGFQIVDVTDPSNPQLLASMDTPDECFRPVIEDAIAFVPLLDQDVLVLDISDPRKPLIVSTIKTRPEPRGMRVVDGHLFLCVQSGFTIVDVRDPSAPVEVSATSIFVGPTSDIEIIGDLAYVALDPRTNGWIWIYDLTDLEDPQHVAFLQFGDSGAYRVRVSDGLAYVAGMTGGLRVVSLSDPLNIVELGNLKAPVDTVGLEVHWNIAYLIEDGLGDLVKTFDVSDPRLPRYLGSVEIPGVPSAIDVDPDRRVAYVADPKMGFHVLDIISPSDPRILSTIRFNYGADDVQLVGARLYVLGDSALHLYDVTDRRDPQFVSVLAQRASGLDVVGETVFLSTRVDGLIVVDFTDSTNPLIIGQYPINARPNEIVVRDQRAFLAVSSKPDDLDPAGLYIIDVHTPRNPELLAIVQSPRHAGGDPIRDFLWSVGWHRGAAYVSDDFRGLVLFDVFDPKNPRSLATIRSPSRAVWFGDDLVYAAANVEGLHIFDIGTCKGCPADLDGDGDADAKDFFAYLDLFASGDDGADIDGDGDIDAEDFFGYLDLFVAGCP